LMSRSMIASSERCLGIVVRSGWLYGSPAEMYHASAALAAPP
jgi:hypothetical protein